MPAVPAYILTAAATAEDISAAVRAAVISVTFAAAEIDISSVP